MPVLRALRLIEIPRGDFAVSNQLLGASFDEDSIAFPHLLHEIAQLAEILICGLVAIPLVVLLSQFLFRCVDGQILLDCIPTDAH